MAKKRRRSYRRANVEITETTFIPGIIDSLQELVKNEVHIGVDADPETAMIAAIHEFGSPKAGIPARSIIGTGKRKSQAAISKLVKSGVTAIVEKNKRTDQLLKEIGELGQVRLLKHFDRIKIPPLSAIYARRKTSKKILQDEQKLRDSITWKIASKGGRRR